MLKHSSCCRGIILSLRFDLKGGPSLPSRQAMASGNAKSIQQARRLWCKLLQALQVQEACHIFPLLSKDLRTQISNQQADLLPHILPSQHY